MKKYQSIQSRLLKMTSSFVLISIFLGIWIVVEFKNIADLSINNMKVQTPSLYSIEKIKGNTLEVEAVFATAYLEKKSELAKESMPLLKKAVWYAEALLNGAKDTTAKLNIEYHPVEDSIVRSHIDDLIITLQEFEKISNDKIQLITNSGVVGSTDDDLFDRSYSELIEMLNELALSYPSIANVIHDLRYQLADKHLFLEEYLSGDASINPDELREQFHSIVSEIEKLKNRYSRFDTVAQLANELSVSAENRVDTFIKYKETESRILKTYEESQIKLDSQVSMIENEIYKTINKMNSRIVESSQYTIYFILGCLGFPILILLFMNYRLSKAIVTPLRLLAENAKAITNGKLKGLKKIESKYNDEIHTLIESFDEMKGFLNDLMLNLKENTSVLLNQSDKFSKSFDTLGSGSSEIQKSAKISVKSSTNANENMKDILNHSDIVIHGVDTVAVAMQEMSIAIKEVAESCAREAKVSDDAHQQARRMQELMHNLKKSTTNISVVLELIEEIASSTNLLALNATIEAATAGEAGKGFAVVAVEVKELARQSTEATQQIADMVTNVQGDAEKAAKGLDEITKSVIEVNEISQNIMMTVEEQSATASQISNNIQEASESVNEMGGVLKKVGNEISLISKSNKAVEKLATTNQKDTDNEKFGFEKMSSISKSLEEWSSRFDV